VLFGLNLGWPAHDPKAALRIEIVLALSLRGVLRRNKVGRRSQEVI